MDDSVQVKCPRCQTRFRDRARKLTSGYARQCPQCEALIFFEESSPKAEIKEALKQAKRVRRALLEQEETRITKAAPFISRR